MKLLKMILHKSKVEVATGHRSLLATEINNLVGILIWKILKIFNTCTNAVKPDALQRKNLLKDFGLIMQTILKKFREMSPLNHALVRNVSCLTPDNISQKKKTAISKFVMQPCRRISI